MRKRTSKGLPASERANYDVEAEWTEADRRVLADLQATEALLPDDAPRALLSVRLSVFTEDTTSPVRQELDLRQLARDKGYRVIGVASDLNVSATKVPPWKRKSLGDWLNNQVPEFDALLFWKLDRFIRNLGDLNVMISWAQKYEKNLVSKNDQIDLSTTIGRVMVNFIGGIAEIEAANTKTRVESLWQYTKTQGEWLVGKPPYGYIGFEDEDGKKGLTFEEDEYAALRTAWTMIVEEGCSATKVAAHMRETGMMSSGLTTSTLLRRLRNPGLQGYRVEEDKQSGARRSRLVYGDDGQPIKIAEPILTEDEFAQLQDALDRRRRNQPARQPAGATKFLGVLKCSECDSNMTVQTFTNKHGTYSYLRCQSCKSGGLGAPQPELVYQELVRMILASPLGDRPVEKREYARGAEVRAEIKRLQETIAHYMEGLEPGGRYTKTRFTQDKAEATMDRLIAELEAVDPTTANDRWEVIAGGRTLREHWQEGGDTAMAEDLLRAGITCKVTRTKIPGQRAPKVSLKITIPKDVRQRLIVRENDFAASF